MSTLSLLLHFSDLQHEAEYHPHKEFHGKVPNLYQNYFIILGKERMK